MGDVLSTIDHFGGACDDSRDNRFEVIHGYLDGRADLRGVQSRVQRCTHSGIRERVQHGAVGDPVWIAMLIGDLECAFAVPGALFFNVQSDQIGIGVLHRELLKTT
jgi:hypothetical protein